MQFWLLQQCEVLHRFYIFFKAFGFNNTASGKRQLSHVCCGVNSFTTQPSKVWLAESRVFIAEDEVIGDQILRFKFNFICKEYTQSWCSCICFITLSKEPLFHKITLKTPPKQTICHLSVWKTSVKQKRQKNPFCLLFCSLCGDVYYDVSCVMPFTQDA